MKRETIVELTETFEAHAQVVEAGVEFWLARDPQHLLGYREWRNFSAVLTKAKTACEVSGNAIADHFVDVNKMVDIGSGGRREIDDVAPPLHESTIDECAAKVVELLEQSGVLG